MGTRSTIKFIDNGKNICSIYQQYDGYPASVGLELAKFLNNTQIINGFNSNDNMGKANGLGCLSAQFIAKIKTDIGSIYMTDADDEQEYNYIVSLETYPIMKEISIIVNDYSSQIFNGTKEEFLQFCKESE